ncbi:hypothetical protein EWM64_g2779 [Hericium alpestre]|uniref:Uncharacterized protein n=1 Tax=Hericium alpestre TaxID=135208 RepID=A0A4Z0A4H0_9AGAM|nr:hypothetical protein EWM64_g2779 [Hericium alpestre]
MCLPSHQSLSTLSIVDRLLSRTSVLSTQYDFAPCLVLEGSSLAHADPAQDEPQFEPEGFPLGSQDASTSTVQPGGSSPELEPDVPLPQTLQHDEPIPDQDVEMTAVDSVVLDPPQAFSAFWASVTANNNLLATTHKVVLNLFFGIAWEFLSEITVSIPPLMEARLIQALEWNPSHSALDLIKLMLRLGMRFHLPLLTYLADAPHPLGPATIPSHELCAKYIERTDKIFCRPCNACLLRYGGIIWHLAMQFGGADLAPDVLTGPAATYINNDWFFTDADGSHCDNSIAWQDDPVIMEALRTSPYNSAPTLWLNPDSWERGVAWSGSDIIIHVAKPHTLKTWCTELCRHNSSVRGDLNRRMELPARLPQMCTATLPQLADSPLMQQGRLTLF